MKSVMVALVCLAAVCPAFASDYSLNRRECSYVLSQKGEQKDSASIHAEATILLESANNQTQIRIKDLSAGVTNGAGVLEMEDVVASLPSAIPGQMDNIRKTEVVLGANIVVTLPGNQRVEGRDWESVDGQLFAVVATNPSLMAVVFPVTWLVGKMPFFFTVPSQVREGDVVNLPFRKPLDADGVTFSSSERPARLTCRRKEGDSVLLVSDYEREVTDMKLMWHVEVVYNTARGEVENGKLRLSSTMKQLATGDVQVLVEEAGIERKKTKP